jgi:hypothetical protein
MYILASKLIKAITGNRKHFGQHACFAGHLADSCATPRF